MSKLKKKQIAVLITTPIVVSGYTLANGTSNNVTSIVGTRFSTAGYNGTALTVTNSTDETVIGIVTTTRKNKTEIYDVTNKRRLCTTDGYTVYGRLTHSGGVYTLTYYYLDASSIETAFSITGPITINFKVFYRSSFEKTPLDESVTGLNDQFGSLEYNIPIRIENLFAGANNKFITSSGSGKFTATYAFDASSIPFTSSAGIVATTIATALDELKGTPFPNPITSNLNLDDDVLILPVNGNSFINLRYSANSNLLLGSKNDLTEAWGLFNSTAAKIAFGSDSYITFDATNSTIYSANIFLGLNKEISSESNSTLKTTTDVNKMAVALSARNITIQSGIVNSVAAAGSGFNVKTSNAFYTPRLILPNIATGYETSIISNTLIADIFLTLPTTTSALAYIESTSTGKIPYFSNNVGKLADSIISHGTILNSTIAINDTVSSTVVISASTYNIAGDQTTLYLKANGALSDNNKALVLEAANGLVSSTALEIVSGNLIHSNGLVAFNTTIDSTVQINTISTLAIGYKMVNSATGAAEAYASVLISIGLNTKNIALYLNAANGTSNYGLIVENGNSIFGGTTYSSVSALVEFSSTTKAVVFPRMTNTQMGAISSPVAGMIVYNTTYSKFYYRNSSSWSALYDSTTLTGTGTLNKVPVFTGTGTLGSSNIGDNGTTITLNTQGVILDGVTGLTAKQATTALYVQKKSIIDLAASHFGILLGTTLNTQSVDNSTDVIYGTYNTVTWNQSSAKDLKKADGSIISAYNEIILSGSLGKLNLGKGTRSSVLTASGTEATNFTAFSAEINTTNAGTVGMFKGYFVPSLVGITGIPVTSLRYGFYLEDPGQNYLAGVLSIGRTSADPSAILDLTSTSLGVLFPRMTSAEKEAIVSPAIGLMIYQTDGGAAEGIWTNKSGGWVQGV